jgi:hypothetical protein
MDQPVFFFIGLAFILTHEMDAVRAREWRLLPLLARLDDHAGYLVFTLAHIPLYLLLFWGLFGPNGINQGVVRALDIFFIVHVLLHLLFLRHPQNGFRSAASWLIILGAGVAGLLDLVAGF